MSCPRNRIRPDTTGTSPSTTRASVDLPAPDSPTNPVVRRVDTQIDTVDGEVHRLAATAAEADSDVVHLEHGRNRIVELRRRS